MNPSREIRYPRGGAALWTDGSVASRVINEAFFGVAPVVDLSGYVKHYDSPSAYRMVPLRVYTAGGWVLAKLRHWTGVEWRLTKGA